MQSRDASRISSFQKWKEKENEYDERRTETTAKSRAALSSGRLSEQKFYRKRLGRQVSQEELTVSDDCTSLAEYLEKFDLPGRCLMDEQGLAEAGYDVLRSMSQENVCYAEIRFAPLFSETEDMNCSKVIEALLSGLERGRKDFGVEYGVLTCAMRHHSEEENYRMLKAAREYLGSGVCGADLAGAEAAYPMSEFMELFTKAGETGGYLLLSMQENVEILRIS